MSGCGLDIRAGTDQEVSEFQLLIKTPTIYILGGASRIVPRELQKQLKETVPGVQIVVIPGLGHYPDQEATGDFVPIMPAFLAGKNPA